MDNEDDYPEGNDGPSYRLPEKIAQFELITALDGLALFKNDPNLRNQAFNLALVDKFIMDLELNLLRQQFREERTPVAEAAFVSAQSQMWIFAAYELMRTWRQRSTDIIKWADNGGLESKLAHLKGKTAYVHFGREVRARQIEAVIASPALLQKIRDDLLRTYIPYARMEAIRVSIAKHEVRGQKNSVALMPTHGLINRWCGSIDFELENGCSIMGYISRRDIAEELRIIPELPLPRDEDIRSFDDFMRGPPDDLDWNTEPDPDGTAR